MMPLLFDKSEIEGALVDRLDRVVTAFGERTAVRDRGQSLSYAQLDSASERIAATLTAVSNRPDEPVPLICGHNLPLVTGIFGILKAGKCYVVLSHALPPHELQNALYQLQPSVLLCDREHLALAESLAAQVGCALVNLESARGNGAASSCHSSSPDAPAAITFTTGTTGEPKGVIRSQRCILYRAWRDAQDQEIGPDDRVALIFGVASSAGSTDMFGGLLNGAGLCLYDFSGQGLDQLAGWINAEGLTCLHLPLDFYRQWLDALPADMVFPTLRLLTPSGRLCRDDLVRSQRHVLPGCRIASRLSSSETGLVARILYDPYNPPPDEVLPVGYVVPEMHIAVSDAAGAKVSSGEIGELAVRSRYLSTAYWGQPELTARAFQTDPDQPSEYWFRTGDLVCLRDDGSGGQILEFHGRRDERVKVRGYTVELGAVELQLRKHAGIRQAAVVSRQTSGGETRLVAYMEPFQLPGPSPSEMREALSTKLPGFMMPDFYVILAALPRTANGKIDRRGLVALPLPPAVRPELDVPYTAPRTATESVVAAIWIAVLGLDRVGVDDKFLDLGGNSLIAAQIASRVARSCNANLAASVLLQSETVRRMASYIDSQMSAGMNATVLESVLADIENLSDERVMEQLGILTQATRTRPKHDRT